ncbi:putative 4-coumarate--CoA ligase 3, partial [Gonioctena quinquepunctata]
EVSRQLLDSSAKAIIIQSKSYNHIKAALNLMKKEMPIIVIKEKQADSLPQGTISFDEFAESTIDIPDLEPGKANDLVFLPYSSGTTGLPKGVELTHYNIVSNILQGTHDDFNYSQEPTDRYQDVTPGVLPFYHIYGFNISNMCAAFCGTKVVTMDKFTPDLYISVLKNHIITLIYAAPPLVLFLSSHEDVKSEYFKQLKLICSGAAPLGFLDEERFIEKVGRDVRIVQGYGLTETSPLVTLSPRNLKRSEKNAGSIGAAVPTTLLKIINPDDSKGIPLGQNQTGELLIKGPQVMGGYHNRPEETEKAFLDGWLRTGDIAYYNDEGLLFITDRLKELIKVKGFQVPPAELESILRAFPAVEDAAVIGIPHPTYGEVPRAYIVPKKELSLDTEDLHQHVNKKVAKYKQLQGGIKIIDAIPKNPSGKILRRQLRDEYHEKGI